MTQSLLVLNGPGLDQLGEIDRDRYGTATLQDIRSLCEALGDELGCDIDFRQSNDTGEVLKWVVDAGDTHAGIIINPAIATRTDPHLRDAYTAIMHALTFVNLPTIEVHLSNVFVDEYAERPSYVSTVSLGVICGFGSRGYEMAIKGLVDHLAAPSVSFPEGI